MTSEFRDNVHNDRCPECKNTNGEHKPFCTVWTGAARLLGLRQCDLDDMNQGEVINRTGAVYGLSAADTLTFLPADYIAMSNSELVDALANNIEADLRAEVVETWPETLPAAPFDGGVEDDGFVTVYMS